VDGARGAASEAIKNVGQGYSRGRGEETQGKRRGDSAPGEAQLGASRKSEESQRGESDLEGVGAEQ